MATLPSRLKMKLEGIQAMVDEFDLNKRTGIDLPHEVISTTPSARVEGAPLSERF